MIKLNQNIHSKAAIDCESEKYAEEVFYAFDGCREWNPGYHFGNEYKYYPTMVCVCTDDNHQLLGEDYSRKPCLKEYNETQMLAEMGKQFCPNGKLPGLDDLKTYSLQGYSIGQCAEQHAANELLKGLGCQKIIKEDILFGKAVRCVTGEEWPYCKNCQALFNI